MPELPVGWRWESYGGVEVGVPDSWGWGNGDQRLGQWFVGDGMRKRPIVGRPGVTTLVGRRPEPGETVDPDTLVDNTGEVVSLSRPLDDRAGVEHEGDRTTARLDGVQVVVQARTELRNRIVDTIHASAIDHNGCPATHPVGDEPGRRPEPSIDVVALTGVSSVVAAKYGTRWDPRIRDARLESSLRLDTDQARDAVAAIVRAPLGGGPNNAADGMPAYSYGDETVVLTISSDQGRSEIYLLTQGPTTTASTMACNSVGSPSKPSLRSWPDRMRFTARSRPVSRTSSGPIGRAVPHSWSAGAVAVAVGCLSG